MNLDIKQSLSFLAILVSLVVPVIVELCMSPEPQVAERPSMPYQLGRWKGSDRVMPAEVAGIYKQKQARYSFRRYVCPDQLPVAAAIQDSPNYDNLHDLYQCLVMSGSEPKRMATENIRGLLDGNATLFSGMIRNQPAYVLFCYQTKTGMACYPPQGLLERAHLSLVDRRPCRLIELSTRVASDPKAAIARLKDLASLMCAQPM